MQYAQKLVVGQNFGHEIRLDFAMSDWKYAFSKRYMRSRHKYRVQTKFSSIRIIFVHKTFHVSVIISDEMKPRPEWEKFAHSLIFGTTVAAAVTLFVDERSVAKNKNDWVDPEARAIEGTF